MKDKNIFLVIGDLYNGFNPYNVLKKIEKSQYSTKKELELIQYESLKKLLIHAGKHSEFYKEYFKKINFNPSIESLKDIDKLPVVDKKVINANFKMFLSDNAEKPIVILRTTGSTGVPFRFARTRIAQSYKIASRVRFRHWYGVGRADSLLNIGGIPSRKFNIIDWLQHSIHFFATNRFEVFSSDLDEDKCTKLRQKIEKSKPLAIMGYPSGISVFSRHLFENRLSFKPNGIFVNSESLLPNQKEDIIQGFGVIPRSDYVATEGSIAHECPFGGLHVDMEEVLVEIINTDKETGLGEVVVTFLHTFDFPLIRYKIGDIARWNDQKCKCGRELVMIDNLIGRFADSICTPNGKIYTAANINMRIAHFPFINKLSQYQLVQKSKDSIDLRVVETSLNDDTVINEFRTLLVGLFGIDNIRIVKCKEIPREPSGKFRPVIGLKNEEIKN